MAQSSADRPKNRVAIREAADHMGAVADFSVQSLNNIVSADVGGSVKDWAC